LTLNRLTLRVTSRWFDDGRDDGAVAVDMHRQLIDIESVVIALTCLVIGQPLISITHLAGLRRMQKILGQDPLEKRNVTLEDRSFTLPLKIADFLFGTGR